MKASQAGKRVRRGGLLAALLMLAAGCATPPDRIPPPPPPFARRTVKPVVAVTSFENRSGFEGEWRIGTGMADLLVAELNRTDRYEILERQHLNAVMGELGLQRNPLFRPEGKPQPGQLKHCRFQIRGVIHDFTHTGGLGLWAGLRRFVLGGRTMEARVALSLTVVDVESGAILGTATGEGFAYTTEARVEGLYKGVQFGGDAFYRTPLGSATREALCEAVDELRLHIPREYWQPMIADVREDGQLVLNGGAGSGFEEGVLYRVRNRATPVTCPGTGDVLDWLPGPERGRIRVMRIAERVTYAVPVTGNGFARGQVLEPIREQPDGEPLP